MEKKGTWGALQSKPVATELPGTRSKHCCHMQQQPQSSGCQLQGLTPGWWAHLHRAWSEICCNPMQPSYTRKMWKVKKGWGWNLKQAENVLSAVSATRKRKEERERKKSRSNIYSRFLPFILVSKSEAALTVPVQGQMPLLRASGENV